MIGAIITAESVSQKPGSFSIGWDQNAKGRL
jgi:hypothetical protein